MLAKRATSVTGQPSSLALARGADQLHYYVTGAKDPRVRQISSRLKKERSSSSFGCDFLKTRLKQGLPAPQPERNFAIPGSSIHNPYPYLGMSA